MTSFKLISSIHFHCKGSLFKIGVYNPCSRLR